MQPKPLRFIAMGALLAGAGCEPGVPENPTWAADVMPILAANCVRCHTVPAIGGAPSGFRLDTYDDWVDDHGRVVRGAGTMAQYIAARVDHETLPMPPRFGLEDRQIAIIKTWAEVVGDDGRPLRGAPRDGNQPPAMTILVRSEARGGLLLGYEIRDPDHDIVVGELRAGDTVITRELHSGRGEVFWDHGALPSGSYSLTAELDDGSGRVTVDVAQEDVNNPDNVAPAVRILSPGPDAIVASAATPTFDILLALADPDDDELTVTVRAESEQGLVDVVVDQPATAGTLTVSWTLAGVPESVYCRLQVTVSDGTAERMVESEPFILSHRTTTDTFDSIRGQILGARCSFCHPGALIPGLTHDFNKRTADNGPALGVAEVSGLIYRRAVQERTMPPLTLGRLDDATVERLGTWLLAGAP